MSHCKENSFVQEVIDNLYFQNKIKNITATSHTCYNCSKNDPEFITLENDDIPFDEKDKIHKLHDVKVHCTILPLKEKVRHSCSCGDNLFSDRRCAKCVHAGGKIIGSYIKGTGSNKIRVQQALIQCRCADSETDYCYPYFWCDRFELKKDE